MKLFIILTFLVLSNTFLLRPPDFPETDAIDATDPIVNCKPKGACQYFTALYHAFGLYPPTKLLKCFEGKDQTHFFKYLSDVTDLVVDTESRKYTRMHQDWERLGRDGKPLGSLWHCMMETKDFGDLLEALGDKTRDPTVFALVNYIYLQADYGKLAETLPDVDKAIRKGHYWKAGTLKADIFKTIANEVKRKGLSLVSLKAFWNGVHIGMGLPDAKSIYKCWDNNAAAVRLEFLYGMSKAVAEGRVTDAGVNAVDWYERYGQYIIGKISDWHWTCYRNADDTKAESKKVGVDITTPDYYRSLFRFVKNHQDQFWTFQKTIKENLEKYNFVRAGVAHGELLQAAVRL